MSSDVAIYYINLLTKESPQDTLSLASGVRAKGNAEQGDKVNKGPFHSRGQGASTSKKQK